MATNILGLKESFQLTDFINNNYKEYKLNDVAFAAKATQMLGFTVSPSHVKARRIALGIPSAVNRDGHSLSTNERIKKLEERITRLEAKLSHLIGD